MRGAGPDGEAARGARRRSAPPGSPAVTRARDCNLRCGTAIGGRSLRDAAIRHYQAATRINPHYFAAWNNLANLWLERARQLPPGDPRRRGLLRDALRDCDQAIRLRPSWHLPYDNAANAWIELAAHEEPHRCFERAEEQLKTALLNQSKYAEALNDWARLELHRAPDRPELAWDRHRAALAACDAATDGGRRNKLCRQFAADAKLAANALTPDLVAVGCTCSSLTR